MQKTHLDAILADDERSPVFVPVDGQAAIALASGRLTTANTLLNLMQLGQQLETAMKAYSTLPNVPPQQVDDALKAIMTACQAAKDKAAKLLGANR